MHRGRKKIPMGWEMGARIIFHKHGFQEPKSINLIRGLRKKDHLSAGEISENVTLAQQKQSARPENCTFLAHPHGHDLI